jgi:hypothetical protein
MDALTLQKQKKELSELEAHRRKVLLEYQNLKRRHDYYAKAD